MKLIDDYSYIKTELETVTAFNETTFLCLYRPQNRLYVLKKEDKSAKSVYESLSEISNNHLAKIYSVEEKDDCIEVLQEYISGLTLDSLLDERGVLSRDEAIKITADVCDGLHSLHNKGLVHRDINPNNIVIASGGAAVIIDYGIARSYTADKRTDTAILGTPGYAAPEQFGFSQSDSRTDIYAVGVMLNVMLTGELPNVKIADGDAGRIVRKCVEIDSKRRYKSIDGLKKSVDSLITGRGTADGIIRQIPGFRSHNIFWVIFAFFAYAAAGAATYAIFASAEKGKMFYTFVSWIFMFPLPFTLFHNFLGIRDKMSLTRGSSKRSQAIVCTVLGILSIIIGLIIFGLANAK